MLPARVALAHGDPPETLSLVSRDAQGATLVRLNEGLAQRSRDGFRYLCPALWGEDAVVPAAEIPDGPAVIGAMTGLWLLSPQGTVARHPDPAAAGRVLALAGSSAGLFALRQSGDLFQVLRVHADRVETLFGGTDPWDDLAASDEGLQLVRLVGGQVGALRLSLQGDVLAEETAAAPENTVAVLARLAGDTDYALAVTSSLAVELGRIESGTWRSLLSGRAIAGPVQTSDGRWFVGAAGALERFDDERAETLDPAARVTCLRRQLGFAYACSEGGLRALTAEGLGEPLFTLSELRPPDLAQVPAEQRDACLLQWQRYVIDLRSIGVDIPVDAPDAGTDAGAADSDAGSVAGGSDAAAVRDPDAGALPSRGGGGCTVASPAGGETARANLFWLALLAAWMERARRGKGG